MKVRYILFKYQNKWKKTGNVYGILSDYANVGGIKRCVNSGYSKKIVDKDLRRAYALGLGAAPSFVIYKDGKYLQTITGYHSEEYWYLTLQQLP